MNHTECAEIRNQIKPESKKMYISNVATAYITGLSGVPTIKSFQLRHFDDLSEEDALLHTKMLKKILSGKMGKSLMEYGFIRKEDGSSTQQKNLYNLNVGRLDDEQAVLAFLEDFAKSCGASYTNGIYVTLAAFEYAIPVKDKNDEENEEAAGGIYRFIILAVNEIKPADIGLYYNTDENIVENKTNNDLHVLPNPLDGFLYPVFTERQSDVNHVLYYTKDAKKPNDMLVENVLGAEVSLPHDQEKECFGKFLEDVCQDDLDLDLYSQVFGNIRDMVNESEEDELQTLSKEDMRGLLQNAGVSSQRMEMFNAAYDKNIGDQELKAINLVDTDKMNIKLADIVVNVKPDAAYKVKTKFMDGGLYLVIEMDDGLQVNGVDLKR